MKAVTTAKRGYPTLDEVTHALKIYLGWEPDTTGGEIGSFVCEGRHRKPFLSAARKARGGTKPGSLIPVDGDGMAFLSRVARQVRQWHKLTQRQAESAVLTAILTVKGQELLSRAHRS